MKIDFNQPLFTLSGEPLMSVDGSGDEPSELTLRSVAFSSVLNNEQGMDGATKVKRYDLALRIHKSNGSLELKVDEVALVKKMIGKHMSPLVVGQAWPMLDETERPKKTS